MFGVAECARHPYRLSLWMIACPSDQSMHSDGSRSEYFEKHVVHFSGEMNGLLLDGTLCRLGKSLKDIKPYTLKAERGLPIIQTNILKADNISSTSEDSIVRAERMKILTLYILSFIS